MKYSDELNYVSNSRILEDVQAKVKDLNFKFKIMALANKNPVYPAGGCGYLVYD